MDIVLIVSVMLLSSSLSYKDASSTLKTAQIAQVAQEQGVWQ